MACRRYVVSGHVQGVWFRASAREQAERLGIRGHALNLSDGSVEIVACGEDAALEAMATWLRHGPELARVEALTVEVLAEQDVQGFRIG